MQKAAVITQPEKIELHHIHQGHPTEMSAWKQQLITLTCLSFFPLMYLIGRAVITWLG